MRVIITGAAGFLGRKLSARLLEKGTLPQARELFRLLSRRGPLDSSMMEGESSSLIDTAGAGLLHHYLSMVAVPQDDPGLILLVTASGPGYQAGAAHQTSLSAEAFKIVGQIVALQQVMKNLTDMMSPREREEVNFRLAPGESDALMSEPVVNGSETEMASLVGMSLRKCLRLLQSFDVEIEIQGTGRVVSQDPPAGTKLKPGARVFLVLEKDEVDPGYRPPQPAEPE